MIIDTDVIIRFLIRDDSKKADRFEAFLRSGKKAQITDVTIAETYWTLTSFYQVKKQEILLMLESLIALPAIVSNVSIITNTVSILRQRSISFVDAYTAATAALTDKTVISFDRGFDKISGIKRIEP